MEDKKGTKRPRSPSVEGRFSPNDAKTPPSAPSRSPPPPPGSPSEISSCHPRSPVFEQGGPSGNIPVIELSSSLNKDDFFAATARDAEFARWLFGDLNHDLLGPPDNNKVIVPSDSDDKEEMHEETSVDAKAVPFAAVKSSTPASSTANADEDQGKYKMITLMILPPAKTLARAAVAEMKTTHLRLPCQERLLWHACFTESYVQRCYTSSSFV
jgi:hypothetical protein